MQIRKYLQQIAAVRAKGSITPIAVLNILLNDYLKVEQQSATDQKMEQNKSVFTCRRIMTSKECIERIIEDILNKDEKLVSNLDTNEELAGLLRAFFCYYNHLAALLSDELKCKLTLLSQLFTQKDYESLANLFDQKTCLDFGGDQLAHLMDHLPVPHRINIINKLVQYGKSHAKQMNHNQRIEFATVFSLLQPIEQQLLLDDLLKEYRLSHDAKIMELLSYCIKVKPDYLKAALLTDVMSFFDKEHKQDESHIVFNVISQIIEPLLSISTTLPQRLKIVEQAVTHEPRIALEPLKMETPELQMQEDERYAREVASCNTIYRCLFELLKKNPKEACDAIIDQFNMPELVDERQVSSDASEKKNDELNGVVIEEQGPGQMKVGSVVLLGKLARTLAQKEQGPYVDFLIKKLGVVKERISSCQFFNQVLLEFLELQKVDPESAGKLYDQLYDIANYSFDNREILNASLMKLVSLFSPEMAYEKLVWNVNNYSPHSAGRHLGFLEHNVNHFPFEVVEKFVSEKLLPYIEKTIGIKPKLEQKADPVADRKSDHRIGKFEPNMDFLHFTSAIRVVSKIYNISKLKEETRQRLYHIVEMLMSSNKLAKYSNAELTYLAIAKLAACIAPNEISYLARKLFDQYIEIRNEEISPGHPFVNACDKHRVPALCYLLSMYADTKFDDMVDELCERYKACEDNTIQDGIDKQPNIATVFQSLVPHMSSEKLIKVCNFLLPYYRNLVLLREKDERHTNLLSALSSTLGDIAERLPVKTPDAKDSIGMTIVSREEFMQEVIKLFEPSYLIGLREDWNLLMRKSLITKATVSRMLSMILAGNSMEKYTAYLDTINHMTSLISSRTKKFDEVCTRLIQDIYIDITSRLTTFHSTQYQLATELLMKLSTFITKKSALRIFEYCIASHDLYRLNKNGVSFLIMFFSQLITQLDPTKVNEILERAKKECLLNVSGNNFADQLGVLNAIVTLHKQMFMDNAYPMLQEHIQPDPLVDEVCAYLNLT